MEPDAEIYKSHLKVCIEQEKKRKTDGIVSGFQPVGLDPHGPHIGYSAYLVLMIHNSKYTVMM